MDWDMSQSMFNTSQLWDKKNEHMNTKATVTIIHKSILDIVLFVLLDIENKTTVYSLYESVVEQR